MSVNTFQILNAWVSITVLVMSVVVHEFFHGWTANRMGDPTARLEGRLTLNPLAHIDPFMTVVLPLLTYMTLGFPFGGAKPVPVNPFNLTRKGDLLVSIAGPVSNLGLAAMFLLAMLLLHPFVPWESLGFYVLFWGVFLNVILAAFNMLPIPPLDGSHVLTYFIPQLEEPFRRIGFAGILIVLLLLSAGVVRLILVPLEYLTIRAMAWAYGAF